MLFSWEAGSLSSQRNTRSLILCQRCVFMSCEYSECKTLFRWYGRWEAAAVFQSTNAGLSMHTLSAMEQGGVHTIEPITQYRCSKLRLYPIGFCYLLCNSSALWFVNSFGCKNVMNMHYLNCCSEKWDPGAGGNISAAVVEWVSTSVSCRRSPHSYLNLFLVPEQKCRMFTCSSTVLSATSLNHRQKGAVNFFNHQLN